MVGNKLLIRSILLAALFGGAAGLVSPHGTAAQTIVSKQCSACGRSVPITARVGERCPYCGAYWGSESTRYVPGGGASESRCPDYNYRPRNSLERMAFYQAMVRQQMIAQQMLREQQAREDRERRRQIREERCQTQRAEQLAAREEIREELLERTEAFRKNDDLDQRVERYLTTATRFEDRGDLRAAIAQYRLVVRTAPNSPASVEASTALKRLGGE